MVKIVAGDKILMEFSTFGDRYLCIVTDVSEGGRLTVYAPTPALVIKRLRTDKNVLVRFAHDGVLHGFKSEIVNDVDSPGALLEIGPPHNVFHAEERAEPRCSCVFPATVVEGNRAAQAVVEDMSASCSRIRFMNSGGVSFLDNLDQEVKLTFHPFDQGEKGYTVKCNIKKVFVRNGERCAILEFKKEEEDARKKIARFIEAKVCCGIPRL